MKTHSAMKVCYYIIYVLCVLLSLPFIYANVFYRRMFETGFYEGVYDKTCLAKIWNIPPDTALLISQWIAVIFFLSLLLILLSIFIRKWVDKDLISIIVFCLFW